jgi:hypothetical protein
MHNLSSLSSLLEKFKHLKNPREERERLIMVLSKELGFDLAFSDVDVKNDILYLNVSGYAKTEIFMKKENLLNVLNQEKFKISDIR